MARKKKRDNPVFIVCMMLALVMSAIFITLEFMDTDKPTMTTSQPRSSQSNHGSLAHITNSAYASAQAEQLCLQQAKHTKPYPLSLYIDERSTKDLGKGAFRVFINTNPQVAMGSESFYICEVQSRRGLLRIGSIKEVKESGTGSNGGLKGLLDALKNQG